VAITVRITKYRIVINHYDIAGILVGNDIRICCTAGGAAAILKNRVPPPSLQKKISRRFYEKRVGNTQSTSLYILEIGNSKGWIEYDPNVNQPLDKLRDDLIHAADLHTAFYDDGEGRKEGEAA
jgi:hypothetical protein